MMFSRQSCPSSYRRGGSSHLTHLCPKPILGNGAIGFAKSLKLRPSFKDFTSCRASSETEENASRSVFREESEKKSEEKTQEDVFRFQSHPMIDKELKAELDALVTELNDANQRGKRGEGLLFAQLLAILLILLPPLKIKGALELFGTLSITTGIVFTLYGLLSLARNFTPLPEPRKKHKLVVSGMYSYVRHPLYGGSILCGLGFAVLTRNEARLLFTALLWWILEYKVAWEERALTARYPEYEIYRQKVKKFFPYLY